MKPKRAVKKEVRFPVQVESVPDDNNQVMAPIRYVGNPRNDKRLVIQNNTVIGYELLRGGSWQASRFPSLFAKMERDFQALKPSQKSLPQQPEPAPPSMQQVQVIKKYYQYATLKGGRSSHASPANTKNNPQLEQKYNTAQGDCLKTKILIKFKTIIDSCRSLPDLEDKKKAIMRSAEFDVIRTPQGLTSRLFGGKTSAHKAFDTMYSEKKTLLREAIRESLPRNSF